MSAAKQQCVTVPTIRNVKLV